MIIQQAFSGGGVIHQVLQQAAQTSLGVEDVGPGDNGGHDEHHKHHGIGDDNALGAGIEGKRGKTGPRDEQA